MIKTAPTFGRLLAMVVFSASCLAIVLYLWLTFGGSIPLRAESYRFEAKVREAATLPVEADVRVAGVNVGKVKRKELDAGAAATLLEIEMKPDYAPVRRDARLILRQKTLLGETYIEMAPGRAREELADGGRLPDVQVDSTVELDEVFSTFDQPTRRFFGRWVREVDRAVAGRRGRDLNDSLGNLAGFTVDGERLFRVLDERRGALRRLVADGGTVLEAINERDGALRGLVQNSSEALQATASRDDALAETVRILPTFLDETRATLRRVERFSGATRPLVRDLLPAASDLGPTLRDLRDVSPDLRATFRSLDPLIRAGRKGVPALERTVRGAGPVVDALNPFLDELNPVLSLLGFYQTRVAGFLSNGGAALQGDFGGDRYGAQRIASWGRSPGSSNRRAPPSSVTVRLRKRSGRGIAWAPAAGTRSTVIRARPSRPSTASGSRRSSATLSALGGGAPGPRAGAFPSSTSTRPGSAWDSAASEGSLGSLRTRPAAPSAYQR